jgi:hypothetical protein
MDDDDVTLDCLFCGADVPDAELVEIQATWGGGFVAFPAHARCLTAAAHPSHEFFREHPDHDEVVVAADDEGDEGADELAHVLFHLDTAEISGDRARALAEALAEAARLHGVDLDHDASEHHE